MNLAHWYWIDSTKFITRHQESVARGRDWEGERPSPRISEYPWIVSELGLRPESTFNVLCICDIDLSEDQLVNEIIIFLESGLKILDLYVYVKSAQSRSRNTFNMTLWVTPAESEVYEIEQHMINLGHGHSPKKSVWSCEFVGSFWVLSESQFIFY